MKARRVSGNNGGNRNNGLTRFWNIKDVGSKGVRKQRWQQKQQAHKINEMPILQSWGAIALGEDSQVGLVDVGIWSG